mgnify:CR=1 FL=1
MKKKKDSMDKALDILKEYDNGFEPRSIQDYGCFCGIESPYCC